MKTILMAVFICDTCDTVTMIQEGAPELIKDEDDSEDGEGVYNPLGVCGIIREVHADADGDQEVCTGTVTYRGELTLNNGVVK